MARKVRDKKGKKKSSSIEDRIKPIAELPFSVTALFYGPAGTGKTTLASTFPTPHLLVDVKEEGTDSICDVDGISSIAIEEWDDFEELYWYIKDNPKDWKTVTVDAVHPLQKLAIIKAKNLNGKSEDDQTSKRDFGAASGLMNQWITNYRDLSREFGINVVFLAHGRLTEPEEEIEDGSIIPEMGPAVMPSVASTLTGMVKVVGYSFIRQTKDKVKKAGEKRGVKTDYCLRVGPHPFYTAKIRNPKGCKVPDYLIDPSYKQIVQVMKGEITAEKPKAVSKKKSKRKVLGRKR